MTLLSLLSLGLQSAHLALQELYLVSEVEVLILDDLDGLRGALL